VERAPHPHLLEERMGHPDVTWFGRG
jgi:hypothetical protein